VRHPDTGRQETGDERADRNLTELLAELRVALPGVQVLFAFLLVVPFNARYSEVSGFGEHVYFFTLLITAGATVLLIAPTVHHRLSFRRQDKEFLVVTANRLALAGLCALAVAIVGVIVLVTDFLFGAGTTVVAAVAVVLLFAAVWYAIPLARRRDLG
jgi:uncharacterized membrane protein YuzA (DUF378 family)